jgi:hypothetical protein
MSPTPGLLIQRVRLRALRLLRWQAQLWAQDATSPDQGLAITTAEVARLLQDPRDALAAEQRFLAKDPEAAALDAPIAAADRALVDDPGWARLLQAFALSAAEADCLSLLLAATYDRGLRRVIAFLHDDATQTRPSLWLAGRLFGPPQTAGLMRWRLAAPCDAAGLADPGAAWQADPAVALSLSAEVWQDPSLSGCVSLAPADFPCLHPAALDRLLALGQARDISLVGPDGIGRQTLAAQFAARLGRDLLVVDCKLLLATAAPSGEPMVAALRMARHAGAIAYFRDAELVPLSWWSQAQSLGCRLLRGCRQAGPSGEAVTLAPLPTALRQIAWHRHSGAPPPDIVSTQRLTPGEIALCARAAPGGAEAMRAALRRAMPVQSDLLSLLPCPYAWDDLVLHADLQRQLREFESQIRLRWAVMEDWGFSRLSHLGQGISALFGGPSGTGKTMAAQVLARALGLDLYRVDLAGVVNKYIGETEKRLRDVFDACERAGVLLFFDEADALFGSRTQVRDSQDRFANIEIDYLLQRIEHFDGVAILATNRKGDIDPAFLRRMRFVVEFLTPRPEERLALWRLALPSHAPEGTPLLEAIDFPMLAQRLQMTGADIKAAALGAAFLACEEGSRIGMDHVLASAQREMAKHGTIPRVAWERTGT